MSEQGSLDAALDAFQAEATANRQAAQPYMHEDSAVDIQRAIAHQYAATVLLPRQTSWETTMSMLEGKIPHKLGTVYDRSSIQSVLSWDLGALDADREIKLKTTASLHFGAGNWESMESTSSSPELADVRRALGFLHFGFMPKKDGILGVEAVVKRKAKTFPTEAVACALGQRALPLAHRLSIEVSAEDVIDRSLGKPVLSLSVPRSEWDGSDRAMRFLDEENINDLYAAVGNQTPDPTLNDVQAWLAERYLASNPDDQFKKLDDVNELLARSVVVSEPFTQSYRATIV